MSGLFGQVANYKIAVTFVRGSEDKGQNVLLDPAATKVRHTQSAAYRLLGPSHTASNPCLFRDHCPRIQPRVAAQFRRHRYRPSSSATAPNPVSTVVPGSGIGAAGTVRSPEMPYSGSCSVNE